ncbi:CD3324 family protein [Clostridium tagluense]|uniref:CD3324 family protein n=1 Tax=Clostridium tagluense TaxID=360422 RepID=UPI002277F4D1|nr:CD3324 family protein [Clostridium tagluense]
MKACDLLPKSLLEEIQKYAEGCIVYIPNKAGNRRSWGDMTGTKSELLNRNIHIKIDFKDGILIDKLSEKYNLSVESIKKIIYSR